MVGSSILCASVIPVGTRIGVYDVLSPLGAGGMGEVYRARDTKLHRDVAIKVLPESFATDRERLTRFQREAEALAALNHPNIAAIYGVEESPGGVRALVMELVDGPTLGELIGAKGANGAKGAKGAKGLVPRGLPSPKPQSLKPQVAATVISSRASRSGSPVARCRVRPSERDHRTLL